MSESAGMACFSQMAMAAQAAGTIQRSYEGLRRDSGVSRCKVLRTALEERGRMTARDLGEAANVGSRLVSSLLKKDIECGRVKKLRTHDGPMFYELVPNFDESQRINGAIELLESRGFKVLSPEMQADS